MSTQGVVAGSKPFINAATFSKLSKAMDETQRALKAFDAFANPAARLGVGSDNLMEFTQYPLTRLSFNYILLQSLYRSNWVVRKVVDAVAEDLTKNWIRLDTELPPKKISLFDQTIKKTMVRNNLLTTIKWGRLFGGAAAVMVIDGHENQLEEPLDIEEVELGSFKGLIPLDRWSGIYPSGELDDDINSPLDFGLPKYYTVQQLQGANFKIHASRVLRFIGPDLPVWEKQVEMYWGISTIEPFYEELKKFDNTSWNIASLVFRANIVALKQKGLAQMLSGLSASAQAQKNFYATLQAQSALLSNQGMMVLDEEGGLETHQFSFGGLRDVYESFKENICGATSIPYSRLFGRPPGGLATTNEGDEFAYYENIGAQQNRDLDPQLQKLIPVIAMSTWGEVPKDLNWKYNPVRALTNETRSNLAKEKTDSITEVYNTGLISDQEALSELKQQSEETGMWSNISDKRIAEADDKPRNEMEMEAPGMGFEEGGGAAPGKQATDEFVESEHPRGAAGTSKGGQFVAKGAGGGGAPSSSSSSSSITSSSSGDKPGLEKGAHKTAGSFAMEKIKEGKHTDLEIAAATQKHFGTKTDLKSIAWYKNKMKQDTPEWKAKQAAKKAAQAANNAKIADAGKHPMSAEALHAEHEKHAPKYSMLFKVYDAGKYKYVKVNGAPGNSGSVANELMKIVKHKYPSASMSSLGEFNPSKPVPTEGFINLELTPELKKEVETKAYVQAQAIAKAVAEQAAKEAKEAHLKVTSVAKTVSSSPLTSPQRESLKQYTNGEYRYLNAQLRSGQPLNQTQAQNAYNIDSAIKNSTFEQDTYVYRGISNVTAFFGPSVKVGTTVIDNGYLSTSKKFSTASNFSSGGYVARISVKKGAHGIDVSSFSLHASEAEVVLPRGSMFVVKNITGKIVECEYVSN